MPTAEELLIEVLALTALALDLAGKTSQALDTLGQALALGEPEGYIRTFADGLPPPDLVLPSML